MLKELEEVVVGFTCMKELDALGPGRGVENVVDWNEGQRSHDEFKCRPDCENQSHDPSCGFSVMFVLAYFKIAQIY